MPTFENYVAIFNGNSYISFTGRCCLAALTVVLLALICYPIAYGLARVFGPWAPVITLLFTIPLFVSENVRLYGWILFFIKNGVLLGTLKSMFGIELESWLFTRPMVLLGMVYVYLPFMLFPMTLGISMVPNDTREAALDLGATRWQVFREVELPLSMPGIVIGFLLTFVLAVGAIAEAKILGGQTIIPITHDIEIAFTYAQNWPLGCSARGAVDACRRRPGAVRPAALRSRRRPGQALMMQGISQRGRHALIWAWTIAVLVFLYIPGLCIFLASLTATRYFQFPDPEMGPRLVAQDFQLNRGPSALQDLDQHCLRGDGDRRGASPSSGRSPSRATIGRAVASIRSWCCCRSSSRNRCLGSLCSCGSTRSGLTLSWKTAVFAHLVWIIPVVTLVISIQVYSFDPALEEAAFDLGASRWQVLREVTLAGASARHCLGLAVCLSALLGQFSACRLFTTGADTTIPEYLYAKMVAGYTPGVPVLGTVSTFGAALLSAGRLSGSSRCVSAAVNAQRGG